MFSVLPGGLLVGGGVLDHTVVEHLRSLQSRVDRAQELILGIQADLRNLLSELSRKRPADPSESSNSRCLRQRVDPLPSALEEIAPDDEEDLDTQLLEAYFLATIAEEHAQADPAANRRHDQEDDEVPEVVVVNDDDQANALHDHRDPEQPLAPQLDQEDIALGLRHKVEVVMGERGRITYNVSYFPPEGDISDIHHEVARITRRALWGFELTHQGEPIAGTVKLSTLGNSIFLRGKPRSDTQREEASPMSASRRGGAPSSVRAKIARKASRADVPVPDAIQLVQLLWSREGAALHQCAGPPQAIADLLRSLATKHAAIHTSKGWALDGPKTASPAPVDPWVLNDPWAKAASTSTPSGPRSFDLQEEDVATNFEKLKLITSFVTDSGQELQQCGRVDYTLGTKAVVLCQAEKAIPFIDSIGKSESVLILVNTTTAAMRSRHEMKKTQLVVESPQGRRTQMAWAIVVGPTLVQAVQKAWSVKIVEAETVRVTFRLLRSVVSDEEYQMAMAKHTLAAFLGSIMHILTISGRRIENDPDAVSWLLECPRSEVLNVLKRSGTKGCMLSLSKQEEASYDIKVVYTHASSAQTLLESAQDLPHLGICGPAKTGHFLVRTKAEDIGKIRRAVLSEASEYAEVWNLVVTQRYTGRFADTMSLQSIARSLRQALGWECVGLSTKKAGKGYMHVTLGAALPPPTLELAIADEVVILSPVDEKATPTLASSFASPDFLPTPAVPVPGQPASSSTVQGNACENQLSVIESRLEAKLSKFQDIVEKSLQSKVSAAIDDTMKKTAASFKERDDKINRLAVDLKAQAGDMAQRQAEARAQVDGLDKKLTNFATQCDSRLTKLAGSNPGRASDSPNYIHQGDARAV